MQGSCESLLSSLMLNAIPSLSSGYVLGGSGYMLREWLLTPVINPQSQLTMQHGAQLKDASE